MRIEFHPEAFEELRRALDWYEGRESRLRQDFFQEVQRALNAIKASPRTWPKLHDNIRRFLLRRFPFGILYFQHGSKIIILCIMHLKKKPGYWRVRRRHQ